MKRREFVNGAFATSVAVGLGDGWAGGKERGGRGVIDAHCHAGRGMN